MFKKINTVMMDIFTGKDNVTTDIGRVLWAIGVCAFIALTIVAYVQAREFDYVNWGLGFASVLAAGAGALRLKGDTEPTRDSDDEEEARARKVAARLARRRKLQNSEEEPL